MRERSGSWVPKKYIIEVIKMIKKYTLKVQKTDKKSVSRVRDPTWIGAGIGKPNSLRYSRMKQGFRVRNYDNITLPLIYIYKNRGDIRGVSGSDNEVLKKETPRLPARKKES